MDDVVYIYTMTLLCLQYHGMTTMKITLIKEIRCGVDMSSSIGNSCISPFAQVT